VFGKTQVIHEQRGLNRIARLRGRTTPRPVKAVDRPREEWTEIAVPAITDEDTFARVQQRLADNKRFATRGSKVPSLLQALAACAACGYGYYRGHTTTTAGNKIYYYRCIGSDNYRYEGGRVCGSKPVRADYLDQVVWEHITSLLADPALIRAEIARRLEQARTSDPVTRQRTQIELALAKAGASITAMIEAYSEQLITIDELRAKMPHLRAREASLRSQLDALDARAADRDAYLKLADDLEGFLARLRGSATTASTDDRRRVLRLLVKDVLIGPEKITIRHRIPVREPTGGSSHDDATDTEGDMRESYQLCSGRDQPVPAERRVARAGGGRRGPLPHQQQAGRDRARRLGPERHCARGSDVVRGDRSRICTARPGPTALLTRHRLGSTAPARSARGPPHRGESRCIQLDAYCQRACVKRLGGAHAEPGARDGMGLGSAGAPAGRRRRGCARFAARQLVRSPLTPTRTRGSASTSRTQPSDRPRCATSQKVSPSRPSHTAVRRSNPVRRPCSSSRAPPGMGSLGPMPA
jgi:hypothetical protein